MLHTETVKIKVIHLLRRIERIDRDLEELDRLDAAIQQDREYSERLRDSLADESRRLHQLRERILTQVVRNAPQMSPASPAPVGKLPAPVAAPASAPEPEIIVPTKKKRSSSARMPKEAPQARPGDVAPSPRKKQSKTPAAPFQFRYN